MFRCFFYRLVTNQWVTCVPLGILQKALSLRPSQTLSAESRLARDLRLLASRLPDVWAAAITRPDAVALAALAEDFRFAAVEENPFSCAPDTLWAKHLPSGALFTIQPEPEPLGRPVSFETIASSLAVPPAHLVVQHQPGVRVQIRESLAWLNFLNGTLCIDAVSIADGRLRATQALAAYPGLPALIGELTDTYDLRDVRAAVVLEGIARGQSIPLALSQAAPEVSAASFRRLRGVPQDQLSHLSLAHKPFDLIELIGRSLGPERMPSTRAQWRYAAQLSNHRLWPHALQHADWREGCSESVPRDRQLAEVGDYRLWVERTLRTLSAAPETDIARFEQIGIRRLTEWSSRWHQIHPQWVRAVEFSGEVALEWEPLVNRIELSRMFGAETVRELCNSVELEVEGEALSHCVASYAGRCRKGECRIFGIQLTSGERATMEIELVSRQGGEWTLAQIQGRNNREPSANVTAVAARFFQTLQRERHLGEFRLLRADYAQVLDPGRDGNWVALDDRVNELLRRAGTNRYDVDAVENFEAAILWEDVRARIGESQLRSDLSRMLPFVPIFRAHFIPCAPPAAAEGDEAPEAFGFN